MHLVVPPIHQRHPPSLGNDAEHIFKGIDRAHRAAGEANDLIAVLQPTAEHIDVIQNLVDDRPAILVAAQPCAQRGMVDDAATFQMP
jgi:hypothetical protein